MSNRNFNISLVVVFCITFAIFIIIDQLNILTPELKGYFNEKVPAFSGLFINVDENYFRILLGIGDVYYSVNIIISLILAFIVRRNRNFFELLGVAFLNLIPTERKVWGKIYDSSTRGAVSFASIRLLDSNGTIIKQTVTDTDGRYRLQVDSQLQNFSVEVNAGGFKRTVKTFRALSQNVLVNSQLTEDIFLEKAADQNAELSRSLTYFFQLRLYKYIIYYLFIVGFLNLLLGIFATINNPNLNNLVLMFFVLIVVILNISNLRNRNTKSIGQIIDSATGKIIPKAKVDIFSGQQRIGQQTADETGTVLFNADPGNYSFKVVYVVNGAMKTSTLLQGKINENGFLQDDLYVNSAQDQSQQASTTPFG